MTDLVDQTEIEQIVGHKRMRVTHLGRAVSETETFYILHSQKCRDNMDRNDLRDCPFSLALDKGVDFETADAVQKLVIAPHGLVAKNFTTFEFSRYATQLETRRT